MSDWIGDESWWDPFLLSTCRQHVRQEHYDDVIRKAFICVEERIRELTNIDASDDNGYGVGLINKSIGISKSTRLGKTDFSRRLEQRGVKTDAARSFISGAFGLYRNDPAHQLVEYDRKTCTAVLWTVNLILELVEKGRATIDDLWYAVQNPEAVIEPDTALSKLLNEDPAVLRDLFILRGQSSEDKRQKTNT